MVVLRPVRESDLEALFELSRLTTYGLTTLPSDEKILARRIRSSERTFARGLDGPEPGDAYLLVLEDDDGKLVGTSGIVPKVGGFEPFYAYRIETRIHESERLGVRKEIRALHLVAEHDGPCEIGSLFLAPEARRGGNGRLLSLARFLLIAERPQAFDPIVIAEMRGVIDEHGHSHFWEALGRHFFDVDFPTADYLSIEDKRFIADLMPTHPIYIPLLPPEAQAVIGRVHPNTEPALHLLEREGFRDSGMVDIFEAGPVVRCPRDEIRTVRESEVVRITAWSDSSQRGRAPDDPALEEWLVARRGAAFRAGKGPLERSAGGVALPAELADRLEVKRGDEVRVARMRPPASGATG